jgi:hypothetical protein
MGRPAQPPIISLNAAETVETPRGMRGCGASAAFSQRSTKRPAWYQVLLVLLTSEAF